MHELSIAMSIVEMAEEEAERRGATRVDTVFLRVGPLSGVVPQALRSSFELARENTPLADARLVIEDVPIVMLCPRCEAERDVRSLQQMSCAVCGSPPSDIVHGRELEVTALELS